MAQLDILVKKDNGNCGEVAAGAGQLPAAPQPSEKSRRDRNSLRSLRAEAEVHVIVQALHETDWNRKQAARLLSISYRGLLYKIRQYDITRRAQPALEREDGQ